MTLTLTPETIAEIEALVADAAKAQAELFSSAKANDDRCNRRIQRCEDALRHHAPALIAEARELAALRATCREVAGELREHGRVPIQARFCNRLADRLDPKENT